MNEADVNKYRILLLSKRAEVARTAPQREDLWIVQSNEQIETVQLAGQREFAARTLERETKSLMQIGAALKRIENGEFGICLDCEEHISHKRLAARAVGCILFALPGNARRERRQLLLHRNWPHKSQFLDPSNCCNARNLLTCSTAKGAWKWSASTADKRMQHMIQRTPVTESMRRLRFSRAWPSCAAALATPQVRVRRRRPGLPTGSPMEPRDASARWRFLRQ